MFQDPLLEHQIRALRLLDPRLSDLEGPNGALQRPIVRKLLALKRLADEEAASALVAQVFQQDADPLDGLFPMARDLVHFRFEIPRCREPAAWHYIVHDVDTDLIVAARLAESRHPPTLHHTEALNALDWPSVLAPEGFHSEQVQTSPLSDNHVHLGGGLPGSFFWLAVAVSFTPMRRLLNWDIDQDNHLWTTHMIRAVELRNALIQDQLKIHIRDLRNLRPPPPGKLPPEPFVDDVLLALAPAPELRAHMNPVTGERFLLWHLLWVYRQPDTKQETRIDIQDYVRLRNSFIRHLTYQPGNRGLTRFVRTFSRQNLLFHEIKRRKGRAKRRAARAALQMERFRVRHALRYQFSDPTDAPWSRNRGANLRSVARGTSSQSTNGQGDANDGSLMDGSLPAPLMVESTPWRPARQVELRITPENSNRQGRVLFAYLKGIQDFASFDVDSPLVRVGLLFHLIRSPYHANSPGDMDQALRGILSLLADVPKLRHFVVGIDLAGRERDMPPRDATPFFNHHYFCNSELHAHLGGPPIQLKRTCHAGEDFEDLLTGLRYVHDAARLFNLTYGERLGHGLALCWASEKWYANHQVVVKKDHNHLLDIIWAMFLARSFNDVQLDRNKGLKQLAQDELFEFLEQHYPLEKSTARSLLNKLVAQYDNLAAFPTERSILHAMGIVREPQMISIAITPNYIKWVKKIRQRVLQEISKRELVVEICPTSNMLVGGFRSYLDLPYLELNRVGLSSLKPVKHPIMTCINSDDPGLFKTTVCNEFRIMARSLRERKFRAREIAAWLEEARQVGMASSFIPQWSPPTKREIWHHIENLFRDT